MTGKTKDIEEGRFFAVISYISFLCIVSLLLKKENKFAVYHAKQGLALFVFETICFVVSVLPFLGEVIKLAGAGIFGLVSLWGIREASRGSYFKIPVISEIAKGIIL